MRILIIEDDCHLAELLSFGLEAEGFSSDICNTGTEGLRFALENAHDLILLDRMLPGMPGEHVLKRIRSAKISTPVIFITALGDFSDKIECLDLGADDYLVKPFDMGELMARIRSVMRRTIPNPNAALALGDLTFFEKEGRLLCKKQTLILSQKEAELLSCLFRHPDEVLARWQIIGNVWGLDTDIEDGNLDNYIYLLRKKLAKLDTDVQIKTVHRQGYRLVYKQENCHVSENTP